MSEEIGLPALYPAGEHAPVAIPASENAETLDTFGGAVKVEWDGLRPLTPFGPSVYFIEFLKVSGVLDALIADCPLHFASTPRGKSSPLCGWRWKDFPRIRRTSRSLLLVQLIRRKFAPHWRRARKRTSGGLY